MRINKRRGTAWTEEEWTKLLWEVGKHSSVGGAARALGFTRHTALTALFRRRGLDVKNYVGATVKASPPPAADPVARADKIRSVGGKSIARLIIPDSHGAHINRAARDALIRDCAALKPEEIVWLGDHLDCGGTFSAHQRSFTNEMTEAYEDDYNATNEFMDAVQKASPNSEHFFLEGNHEAHVERWASRTFTTKRDADKLLEAFGPQKVLNLRERGIPYFRRSEYYQGISIQGTIRRGKCYFTHGIVAAQHATHIHLVRFGDNVVHGHTHRSQSSIQRTVRSDGFGAWCPGTLAELQPLYLHTNPSTWTHGYGLQFVAPSGVFLHWNVPLVKGESLLLQTIDTIAQRRSA